jgi:hypothetical protein
MRTHSIILVLILASGFSACAGTGAYRNARFTVGSEWTSDREHLYARLGSPDSVENENTIPPRTIEEGAGLADSYPFETWHYEHLHGVGDNVDLEFVDDCMCGNYELTYSRASIESPRAKESIAALLAREP